MTLGKTLLISYLIFMVVLGIDPYSRDVWLAENIPMWRIPSARCWLCLYS